MADRVYVLWGVWSVCSHVLLTQACASHWWPAIVKLLPLNRWISLPLIKEQYIFTITNTPSSRLSSPSLTLRNQVRSPGTKHLLCAWDEGHWLSFFLSVSSQALWLFSDTQVHLWNNSTHLTVPMHQKISHMCFKDNWKDGSCSPLEIPFSFWFSYSTQGVLFF